MYMCMYITTICVCTHVPLFSGPRASLCLLLLDARLSWSIPQSVWAANRGGKGTISNSCREGDCWEESRWGAYNNLLSPILLHNVCGAQLLRLHAGLPVHQAIFSAPPWVLFCNPVSWTASVAQLLHVDPQPRNLVISNFTLGSSVCLCCLPWM